MAAPSSSPSSSLLEFQSSHDSERGGPMAAAGFFSAGASPSKKKKGAKSASMRMRSNSNGSNSSASGGGGGSASFLKAIFLRRKKPSVKDSLAVVGLRKALLIGMLSNSEGNLNNSSNSSGSDGDSNDDDEDGGNRDSDRNAASDPEPKANGKLRRRNSYKSATDDFAAAATGVNGHGDDEDEILVVEAADASDEDVVKPPAISDLQRRRKSFCDLKQASPSLPCHSNVASFNVSMTGSCGGGGGRVAQNSNDYYSSLCSTSLSNSSSMEECAVSPDGGGRRGLPRSPRRRSDEEAAAAAMKHIAERRSSFATMMFAREGPKIRAKDLMHIPLVPPTNTPPPQGGKPKSEDKRAAPPQRDSPSTTRRPGPPKRSTSHRPRKHHNCDDSFCISSSCETLGDVSVSELKVVVTAPDEPSDPPRLGRRDSERRRHSTYVGATPLMAGGVCHHPHCAHAHQHHPNLQLQQQQDRRHSAYAPGPHLSVTQLQHLHQVYNLYSQPLSPQQVFHHPVWQPPPFNPAPPPVPVPSPAVSPQMQRRSPGGSPTATPRYFSPRRVGSDRRNSDNSRAPSSAAARAAAFRKHRNFASMDVPSSCSSPPSPALLTVPTTTYNAPAPLPSPPQPTAPLHSPPTGRKWRARRAASLALPQSAAAVHGLSASLPDVPATQQLQQQQQQQSFRRHNTLQVPPFHSYASNTLMVPAASDFWGSNFVTPCYSTNSSLNSGNSSPVFTHQSRSLPAKVDAATSPVKSAFSYDFANPAGSSSPESNSPVSPLQAAPSCPLSPLTSHNRRRMSLLRQERIDEELLARVAAKASMDGQTEGDVAAARFGSPRKRLSTCVELESSHSTTAASTTDEDGNNAGSSSSETREDDDDEDEKRLLTPSRYRHPSTSSSTTLKGDCEGSDNNAGKGNNGCEVTSDMGESIGDAEEHIGGGGENGAANRRRASIKVTDL